MALIATPGAVDANSYLTVAEATDFFASRYGADVYWPASLTDAQKEALLITATAMIETFTFGGYRTESAQSLAWPRASLIDNDGYSITQTDIPKKLKQATCELVYWYLSEDDRAATDLEIDQLEEQKTGPLTQKFKAGAVNFPPKCYALLQSIGPGVLLSTCTIQVGKKQGITTMAR